jgi:hypothetical protein
MATNGLPGKCTLGCFGSGVFCLLIAVLLSTTEALLLAQYVPSFFISPLFTINSLSVLLPLPQFLPFFFYILLPDNRLSS